MPRQRGADCLRRAPFPAGAELELRQVFDVEDFGEAVTPEIKERDQRLREQAGNAT